MKPKKWAEAVLPQREPLKRAAACVGHGHIEEGLEQANRYLHGLDSDDRAQARAEWWMFLHSLDEST